MPARLVRASSHLGPRLNEAASIQAVSKTRGDSNSFAALIAAPARKYARTMQLTTCLWFDGNAREAAEFYVAHFPNSSLNEHWTTPADTPGNDAGDEVTVDFTIFGQPFVGRNGGPMFHFNEAISFRIPCATQHDIDYYWELLTSNGGAESQCGWLRDRFGISWQVVSPEMGRYLGGPSAAGAAAATNAMLSMTKIVLSELRDAYEGAANGA